jgi:hypothetical protein
MEPSQRLPETEFLDIVQVREKVIESVSEARRGKRRSEQTQAPPSFEVTHEGWVEKEIDEQLLKIKVVAVPKFGDRSRFQRPARVPQRQKAGHAATCHDLMTPNLKI